MLLDWLTRVIDFVSGYGPEAVIGFLAAAAAIIGYLLYCERQGRQQDRAKSNAELDISRQHSFDSATHAQKAHESLGTANSRLQEQATRIQDLTDELEQGRNDRLRLQQRIEALQEEIRVAGRLRSRRNYWRHLAEESQQQIQAIASSDGRVWEQPIRHSVQFLPARDRRAKIVSVLNFKGGVGKTMLTGNLAVALAERMGKSVLAVDLDYQMNLTKWCLNPPQLAIAREGHKFVNALFQPQATEVNLKQLTSESCCSQLRLIPAEGTLVDDEMRSLACWLAGKSTDDVRLRLLRGLHHTSSIADAYDWILLDCPPRMTTATINAICASDYYFVPVVLDQVSVLAVPELLKLIRELKKRGVCPDLALKGVIANQTSRTKLATRERNLWNELARRCGDEWGDSVRMFEHVIPNRVCVKERSHGEFAALQSGEIGALFRDVAEEFAASTHTVLV